MSTTETEHGALLHPYAPNPRTLYRCPYCNKDARLLEKNIVVDSYKNVCHLACLDKARNNNLLAW